MQIARIWKCGNDPQGEKRKMKKAILALAVGLPLAFAAQNPPAANTGDQTGTATTTKTKKHKAKKARHQKKGAAMDNGNTQTK
jgi:hypothetical protein